MFYKNGCPPPFMVAGSLKTIFSTLYFPGEAAFLFEQRPLPQFVVHLRRLLPPLHRLHLQGRLSHGQDVERHERIPRAPRQLQRVHQPPLALARKQVCTDHVTMDGRGHIGTHKNETKDKTGTHKLYNGLQSATNLPCISLNQANIFAAKHCDRLCNV